MAVFWRKKKLTYNILIPPITKPIEEFSHSEAKSFFEWYISQIPYRVRYLSACIARDLNIDVGQVNLTPDSLVVVWRWFLKIAQTERSPQGRLDELNTFFADLPIAHRQYMVNEYAEQFSLQTEYILRDIGMYLGEVFIRNHSSLCWSYYSAPKSDFYVNRPLLIGFEDSSFTPTFKMVFEPIHMAGIQAANIWDKSQKDTDLFCLYRKWSMFVPESSSTVLDF